ncbi:unnamed protein product [Triticum turgidum subsp. durum]|uniref:Small ribosomal subunit protein uS8c n=1 Tax=Triticum turgidum subsp. durum TaxID=4567 RepID=A0A9R1C5H9_TRITD|nr:unnamed protein product [Triticum turgidum subsp. durum]
MGRRILNDALRKMVNAERRGKATAQLQPISGFMISFLNIMKHRGIIFLRYSIHIGMEKSPWNFREGLKIAKLTYRQDLKAMEIDKYRTRMLPTRQRGYVVVTTPNGVLDH